jgi:mono/diheme cytochrome c family protein
MLHSHRSLSRTRAFSAALAALAFAATTLWAQSEEWTAPARAAKRPNPIPATPDSISKGKVLYTNNCLSCHGETGQGNGPKAKDLDKRPQDLRTSMKGQSDGALFWKSVEGRKPMPSFEKDLKPDDLWNVINYMRTLAPKK